MAADHRDVTSKLKSEAEECRRLRALLKESRDKATENRRELETQLREGKIAARALRAELSEAQAEVERLRASLATSGGAPQSATEENIVS